MVKAFKLLTILLLALMLCSCGNGLVFEDAPTIQYARDNAELLYRCVDEISSYYLSNGWRSTLIFAENGNLIMCKNSIERENAKIEIRSLELSELFQSKKIKKICIWSSEESVKSIEFHVDSVGMGSASLAAIVYIPSDNVKDAEFYSNEMHFRAFREGYMGEIDGSDDYFYYVQIFPCFFYIEYGD